LPSVDLLYRFGYICSPWWLLNVYSYESIPTAFELFGGVTGRPEMVCPRANALGSLVPKLIVLCDTMSLTLCTIQYVLVGAKWRGCIDAGTLCFQENSSRGTGFPELSYGDNSFRDVPSPHQFFFAKVTSSIYVLCSTAICAVLLQLFIISTDSTSMYFQGWTKRGVRGGRIEPRAAVKQTGAQATKLKPDDSVLPS